MSGLLMPTTGQDGLCCLSKGSRRSAWTTWVRSVAPTRPCLDAADSIVPMALSVACRGCSEQQRMLLYCLPQGIQVCASMYNGPNAPTNFVLHFQHGG